MIVERMSEPAVAGSLRPSEGLSPEPGCPGPASPEEGGIADALAADPSTSAFARRALRRALTVAWLAVGLGISMQALILVARLAAGGAIAPAQLVASAAQGVSWSVLVCGAVAIGTVAARARVALTGALGLLAGPIAWGLAKGVQRAVQSLLGVAQDPITPFFFAVSAVKGVEYAVLGAALGYMVGRSGAGLRAHLTLGAVVGVVFASATLGMTLSHTAAAGRALAAPALAGLVINELAFPIGCSLVLYLAQRLRSIVELSLVSAGSAQGMR